MKPRGDVEFRRGDGKIVIVPHEYLDTEWFAAQTTVRRRKAITQAEADRRLAAGWRQDGQGRWLRPATDKEWFDGKGDYVEAR